MRSSSIEEHKINKLLTALRNEINGRIYGYIDKKGIFIIKPRFSEAYDFNSSGTAIVAESNGMRIINTQGEYVTNIVYDNISSFKEGLAIYTKNGNMGVLDERGQEINTKKYNFIGDYTEGRAIVGISNGDGFYKYGFINKEGVEIVEPKYSQVNNYKDEVALVKIEEKKYGLVDMNGKIINTYNYGYVDSYGDGLMIFSDLFGGPYGYINKLGKVVIKPIYTQAEGFKDKVAIISKDNEYNGPYGVINLIGEYVFKPIYNSINSLGEERIALGMPIGDDGYNLRSIYAIADIKGNMLSDFKYLVVGDYNEGIAYASNNTSTFFIDKKGKIVKDLPTVNGSGELVVKDGIVFANIDYSPYYLRKSGEIIYKPNDEIVLSKRYSVLRERYKSNINYLIYTPIVKSVRDKNIQREINTKLKAMSYFKPYAEDGEKPKSVVTSDDVLNYSYYGDFKVQFFKKNLLILNLTGYYYPIGAAHGMPSMKTPSIDLKTGRFYALEDLFIAGIYYVGELNKIINNMILTDPKYEYIFKDSFKGIEANQGFYIDENNLYIYFPPYDIGPYSAGFITFKIPFISIDGMINKNGEFYKSFN